MRSRGMVLVVGFVLAAGACGGSTDEGAADVGAVMDVAADVAAVEDVAPSPDVGGSGEVAVTEDIEASVDVPSTPDAGPTTPLVGALGGVCDAGETCAEGSCEAIPDRADKICTKACLSNYACPEPLRCEAITAEDMRCLAGPRGTAALGEPCGADKGNGCASGLCVDADPDAGIAVDTCTEPCKDDAACASPFPICFGLVDLCLPIPSGSLGGRCKSSGECDEGACTTVAGVGERCTIACKDAAECGQAYLACTPVGAESWCLLEVGGD